jgi:hypothetical protein
MSTKAKAIKNLYKMGRLSLEGVRQAVYNNIITKEEYELITGQNFVE